MPGSRWRSRPLDAVLLLEELAVLRQGEVGVERDLGRQPLLQGRPFGRPRTGDRLGLYVPRLPAQLEVAFLMVGTDMPKVLATSSRAIPRSTAASTLSLRSFEYAFMPAPSHRINAQANRYEMLGHATIAITLDTYSHVLPNMQHNAVAAMEEAFS